MAKSNFATRLTKELRRSPKKTAVLALMVVVALWFWAPLAWKWLAPQAGEAAATAAANDPLAATPESSTSSTATPAAAGGPALNWRELADVLQSDPLLSSARMDEKLVTPFAVPEVKVPEAEERETHENVLGVAASEATTSPADLGLVIRSTITGGRHAVATINGRSCRVGDVIAVPAGEKEYEFTITRIDAGEVTLTAGRMSFVLAVEQPDSTMQFSQAGDARPASAASSRQRIVIGARLGE